MVPFSIIFVGEFCVTIYTMKKSDSVIVKNDKAEGFIERIIR